MKPAATPLTAERIEAELRALSVDGRLRLGTGNISRIARVWPFLYGQESPQQLYTFFSNGIPGLTLEIESHTQRRPPYTFNCLCLHHPAMEEGTSLTLLIDRESRHAESHSIVFRDGAQGKSLLRPLLARYTAWLEKQGIHTINLTAGLLGSYIWARCGYVPNARCWKELVPQLQERLGRMKAALEPTVYEEVSRLVASSDPRSIWRIAQYDILVPTPSELHNYVSSDSISLGKAMLIGQQWKGTLDLQDAQAMEYFHDYTSAPQELLEQSRPSNHASRIAKRRSPGGAIQPFV